MKIALLVAALAFLVVLVGGILFLRWRRKRWDDEWRLKGEALDRVAFGTFGFERKPGETDAELRARLQAFLRTPPGRGR